MNALMLRGNGRIETLKAIKSADGIGEGGTSVLSEYTAAMRDLTTDDNSLATAYTASVWAFRCTNVRASKVASIPHRVISKKTQEPIPDHPLITAIQAAYWYSHRSLLFDFEMSICLYGEVFIELIRNLVGMADGLKWLNPLGVEPFIYGSHILHYDVYEQNGGAYKHLNPEHMIYYHTANPRDDLRGLAVMTTALDSVNVDRAIQKSTKAWFLNDARPDGIISPPEGATFPDPMLARLQQWWQNRLKGPRNRGKTAILPTAVRWQQVQREPIPEQPELKMDVRRETCAAFGVPVSIAGGWDDASYQSAPEQRKSLYEETIFPECNLIAEFITEVVLPEFDRSGGSKFEFDKSAVQATLEDQEKKSRIAKDKWLGGLMTMNEARLAGGDKSMGAAGEILLIPSGYTVIPINQLADAPQLVAQASVPFALPAPSLSLADPNAEQNNSPRLPLASSAVTDQEVAHGSTSLAPDRTADRELSKWEKAALQSGKSKALRFQCYAVPAYIAAYVRKSLELTDFDNRAMVRSVFTKAARLYAATEAIRAGDVDVNAEVGMDDSGAVLTVDSEIDSDTDTVPQVSDAEIEAARLALKLAGVEFGVEAEVNADAGDTDREKESA